MSLHRRAVTTGLLASIGLCRFARAADLPQPTERVILTITGKIGTLNVDNEAQFDRPMLEALGWHGFTTNTPWYDGPTRFDGVKMAVLMDKVKASGEMVVATALNDYETRIPISDFTTYDVILALKRNGEYMAVRDKGPLFIVYPFDSNADLKSQKYYGRCAWQLSRLAIS
jgi:hypothetical protein